MPRLTPGEYHATAEKIAKVNERAAKKGFTGRLELTGERREVTRRDDFGFNRTEVFYDASLTGEPPSYNGWTFLGRVDIVDAGFVVASAPGAPEVNREGLKPGWCDHCKTNRFRRNTYIVANDTGEQLQVGSTCVKDFTGWEGRFTFFATSDFDNDDDFWGGGSRERGWTVDTVLAYAWAATTAGGYVPVNDYTRTPTKSIVVALLEPTAMDYKRYAAEFAAVEQLADQAAAKAVEVREFIASDNFNGDSDYVTNLKVLVAGENIGIKHVGLVASAPQALVRYQERLVADAVKAEEKAELVNEFVGDVKDKLELTVTVKTIRFIPGDYGTTTLYTMVSDTNHVFKWFSSNAGFGEASEGQTFRIRGTVKAHDEYQGMKSTVLTRCKELVTA